MGRLENPRHGPEVRESNPVNLPEDLPADSATTARIVVESSRVLNVEAPNILADCLGPRPFRRSGVRLGPNRLRDGRTVVHSYGHGGSGCTLSWGCGKEVFDLATG